MAFPYQRGYGRRPTRLMARPDTPACFGVKVFVEQEQFAPVRVRRIARLSSMAWPVPLGIGQEQSDEAPRQVGRDLVEGHELARACRAFHAEARTIEQVGAPQSDYDQQIDGEPHRSAPIAVAAEGP
ncbi:hypothetical protein [Lichenibacterium dinghuense]|uniref:hypothetical protein n=1 Tax=Lichenibacterium dinghuense TaxID=2895977 RepID=UPI001F332D0C|nr:hypothetical protein [Lichenibacterium sp. 6Y81]